VSKKSLVIVESPTKAKTISRFLGSDFVVTSSMGHVRDLPASKLGVDVDNDFEPQYVIPIKAKKTIAELQDKAKNASSVILATDEDREGEAIAWHLLQALGLANSKSETRNPKKGTKSEKDIKRIVFHEITKSAIEEALKSPRELDMHLVDAQQARRVLDRLVGYELSPFLWKKIMRGLSAGRVQSVAVRLIVEREEEIKKFKPEEYWNILATFEPESNQKTKFTARLNKINDKTLKKFDINTELGAKKILSDLDGAKYRVLDIQKKEVKRTPAPPFTTSTLQQECARKFGMSAKQTMMIAQQLYEGVEAGQEASGLITYMRTDSVNLANQAIEQIRTTIENTFGKVYLPAEPRRYKTKSRGAQEAHEAIRPTDANRTPDSLKQHLDAKQLKVYSLIWKRALACQMKEAIFDQTAVDIEASNPSRTLPSASARKPNRDGSKGEGNIESGASHRYTFRANGQVIKFDGFIKVYEEGSDEKAEDEIPEGVLPELSVSDILKLLELLPKQSFTEPPPRYSDASLIKALEEHGIGRPSTYAPIISTILARKYVEKIERRFYPTEIGGTVTNMLKAHFPEIVDINFTAKMEDSLDDVAEGKQEWQPMIRDFYKPFKSNLESKTESVEKYVEKTDVKCPTCGKPMIIRYGRFGKFLACSDYPNCKTTQPLPEEKKKEEELNAQHKGEKCPICGKQMEVKRGRFGYFLGCPDYPTCKGIKKIENKTGIKCPTCKEGDVVQKKNKRGAFFYACNRYPKCDYTASKLPEKEEEEAKAS